MSAVTLAIDGDLLAAARRYAQDHGTTLNALVCKVLEQLADESHGSSRGRRRTRDQLHERLPAAEHAGCRTARR